MAELSSKQHKAIPVILAAHTIKEGVKKARISRKTYYEWLKNPEFKRKLDEQRQNLSNEAFGQLEKSLEKAVRSLIDLLDSNDTRLKRLVCNDIIGHYINYKALEDLTERVEVLERRNSE